MGIFNRKQKATNQTQTKVDTIDYAKGSSLLKKGKSSNIKKEADKIDWDHLDLGAIKQLEMEFRKELQNLRFQTALGTNNRVHVIRKLKANIARTLTYQAKLTAVEVEDKNGK